MSAPATRRTALLAGATGLIGGHLLDLLLVEASYSRIVALVRRPLDLEHGKLDARVVDFDHLDETADPPPVDDVFCCLGSTIRKAGSQAAFRKVDHDYVVATARLGLACGARRFLLVSAIGASSSAKTFYSRVKGEAEESVTALGYPALHIFQPSILMGARQENRPGERLGIAAARVLNGLMVGPLSPYRGIRPETVAAAMVAAAASATEGRQVHTYSEIERLAQAFARE